MTLFECWGEVCAGEWEKCGDRFMANICLDVFIRKVHTTILDY